MSIATSLESTSFSIAMLVARDDDGRWCVDASDIAHRCYDAAGLLRTLHEHTCDLVVLTISDVATAALLDEIRVRFPEVLVLTFASNGSAGPVFDKRVGAWVARPPESSEEFAVLTETLLAGSELLDVNKSGVRLSTQLTLARQQRFNSALGALSMVFQPIVSRSERRAVAYEALLRANSDAFASPPVLFDEAVRLDRVWDVSRIARARTALRVADAPADTLCFVNVHVRDLADPWLTDERNPLLPFASRVVFELTEQADTSQLEALPETIQRLRELGYRVAADDLGAGYSALSVLAAIEPEFMKVDMSIVRGVDTSKTKQRLIRSMVSLARDLGACLICEGVETVAESEALCALGVDWLQGYLYGRPAAAFAQPAIGGSIP